MRGLGSQEWPPGLEVRSRDQGDDSAGSQGRRCPWDGEAAAINLFATRRQPPRQRSLDATDSNRETVVRVSQMWRGFQLWRALESELGWRRAAACGESRSWRQPSQAAAPPGSAAFSLHPASLRFIYFFFVGRSGGGRWCSAHPSSWRRLGEPLLQRRKSPASSGAPWSSVPHPHS